jgi:N-acetylated-alpha-linked acidic dipeptidase
MVAIIGAGSNKWLMTGSGRAGLTFAARWPTFPHKEYQLGEPMSRAIIIAALAVTAVASRVQGADEPLYGFSSATSTAQRDWEKRFKAIPSPQIMRDTMRRLSARPHHVGSPYDKDNAEWILARFRCWGLDAHIEQYEVLFPTPKTRVVELIEPIRYVAKLQEPVVASDPTSNQQSEQLPSYNAYSIDGDVTAPLVYVNFGTPKDYETLDRLGVSVRGAVVIARYGESWRGIKPKVAAEHGAVGCIIYSDPHEDGYVNGDVFPKGPTRNENGVQRGSVADMPLYPGDPLTPGVAAKGDVKRLSIKEAPTITKIPVLPISYGDAQPLLAELQGPVAPKEFRGGLPITYHVGPGAAKVHLKVESNWDIKPIRNIIARIPGTQAPDQWIIRGNHHDAWVNGADDPVSGQVALLEEARALSELLKQGWKPKRTIIFCAWDGEEPGLLGSTEWCEDHAHELVAHAALYLNSDSNGRGFLRVEGSHSLEKLVNCVARDIVDPEKNISIANRLKARLLTSGNADVIKEIRTRADLRIGALGSGSDYTAFLDHLGIASLNLGFAGEDEGGVYHSVYDDFYWYTHFSDTDFVYGRALAQMAGTLLLRFADADVLPYDFANFADTMHRYVTEVKKLLSDKQEEIHDRNAAIDEHLYEAASDPRHPLLPPPKQAVPPFLNFAPLDNALSRLDTSARRYSKAIQAFARKNDEANGEQLVTLNAHLIQLERHLTSPGGLPRRSWFKHLIYAPGFYTGYGVKTLPGIREGIETNRSEEAEREISRAAQAVIAYAASVDRVADELEKQ